MDAIKAALPANEPVYIYYDFFATRADGSTMAKLCFISFSPDSAKMQAKFKMQNYRDSVKAAAPIVDRQLEFNDALDLSENEFRDVFNLN